jgi:long-chain fatty acid transport protein
LVYGSASTCFSAGFGIYEWSARGNALGGTLVGRADDPSAVAYNPAGITQLDGVQVMAGFSIIHPVLEVRTDGPEGNQWTSSDKSALWMPPHVYATWKVNDRYSFGLGIYSRFGLGSVIDDKWPGRYNSYRAVIEAVSINPNVAVKVTDKLSAAFGVEAMHLTFLKKQKLNLRQINPAFGDGDSKLDADGWGHGFNLALHYQPCEYARLGLTYRSPVVMKVRGDAEFSDIPGAIQGMRLLRDTGASGKVTLPDSFSFGLAVYPTEKLSVELGATYTLWSKYDELRVNYSEPVIPGPGGTRVDQVVQTKNWRDVWRLGVGVEYAALDWLDLRAGYIYDQEPSRSDYIDYMVPANDRHLLSAGLGLHWENWTADLSYIYLMIEDRKIKARPAEGVYQGEIRNADAHIMGLSVSYAF